MKTPQPYIRHVTAIRFLPDASNWRDVCKAMGDENDYSDPYFDDPPPFLDIRNDTISPGEWLVIEENEHEVLCDTEFHRSYEPESECLWKENGLGYCETGCESTFYVEATEHVKFCHNCGGRVTFEPWKESEE